MEIFKNIATVVGCISACIALSVTIIKPLRQSIIESFIRKTRENKIDDKIDKMDKKMDKLLESHKQFGDRLTRVEENVLENEADRLRSDLFDCGNRCRRHIRLHPEEWEHIKDVYHKYSKVLKQNGPGEKEFNFITDYYNNQNFPAYHTQQND